MTPTPSPSLSSTTPTLPSLDCSSVPTGIIPTLGEREVLIFLNPDNSPSCLCFQSPASRDLFLSGSIIFGSICSAAVSSLRATSPGHPVSLQPPPSHDSSPPLPSR